MTDRYVKGYLPLYPLEMHDLLRLIYPEHIRSDDNEDFDLSSEICDNATVDLGNGFEVGLADLLGRVVMLTMPMRSELTGEFYHCLGAVTIDEGNARMVAAVKRTIGGDHEWPHD